MSILTGHWLLDWTSMSRVWGKLYVSLSLSLSLFFLFLLELRFALGVGHMAFMVPGLYMGTFFIWFYFWVSSKL